MRVKSQEFIDYLREVLPPFFARKDVENSPKASSPASNWK